LHLVVLPRHRNGLRNRLGDRLPELRHRVPEPCRRGQNAGVESRAARQIVCSRLPLAVLEGRGESALPRPDTRSDSRLSPLYRVCARLAARVELEPSRRGVAAGRGAEQRPALQRDDEAHRRGVHRVLEGGLESDGGGLGLA